MWIISKLQKKKKTTQPTVQTINILIVMCVSSTHFISILLITLNWVAARVDVVHWIRIVSIQVKRLALCFFPPIPWTFRRLFFISNFMLWYCYCYYYYYCDRAGWWLNQIFYRRKSNIQLGTKVCVTKIYTYICICKQKHTRADFRCICECAKIVEEKQKNKSKIITE